MSPAVGPIFTKNGSFFQGECQKNLMIKTWMNIGVETFSSVLIQRFKIFP